jgi:hypothetical protein
MFSATFLFFHSTNVFILLAFCSSYILSLSLQQIVLTAAHASLFLCPYPFLDCLCSAAFWWSFPGHVEQVKNPNDFFTGRCLFSSFFVSLEQRRRTPVAIVSCLCSLNQLELLLLLLLSFCSRLQTSNKMKLQTEKCRICRMSGCKWETSCFSQCLLPPRLTPCLWKRSEGLLPVPLSCEFLNKSLLETCHPRHAEL